MKDEGILVSLVLLILVAVVFCGALR
jgi:hypothetical protein